MKYRKWFYHWPGMVYAYDLITEEPVTKAKAKQIIRQKWDLKRLPKHAEVWPMWKQVAA